MITSECTLYCNRKLRYFDHRFTKGKYYKVEKTTYTTNDGDKYFFTMIDDGDKDMNFQKGSIFETKTLPLHFQTESQLRKDKLKKIQNL